MERRSRAILKPFADNFYNADDGANQGRRMTLAQAAAVLNRIPGFNAALLLARVNMKSKIASTLRLFPDLFAIDGNYVDVSSREL